MAPLDAEPGAVTAVLGPTNTGKTRLAIDRMLGRASGVIALPLRLLAREVYDRVVEAKGVNAAALITGEERIAPPGARYHVCTTEACPTRPDAAFVAIDEVQLAGDPDRGHVFTQRILHARGREETMLLGAETMRPLLRRLVPEARHDARERFSTLSHIGAIKLTKLPRRTAVVAFSAEEVYAIAEILRRHKGGAAVVMGALSPATRNAQVELYQSGEVDFLVATDAIGMGLNMDVDHVAFAAMAKYDGRRRRPLRADEVAQIAGRAGRFRNDGTFGATGECPDIAEDVARRVEEHRFDPISRAQWRAVDLDFASCEALLASLAAAPPDPTLIRTADAIDEAALSLLSLDPEIAALARGRGAVARLWSACQLPDFRNITRDQHVGLVRDIARRLLSDPGVIPPDWIGGRIAVLNDTAGEVDALAARLAHIRTWTYAANRADWLDDPDHWRGVARAVEDRLSEALHERLTQRFVDRRTSALMRGLRVKTDMIAAVKADGEVLVEGHFVGRLNGLAFEPDRRGDALEARALRAAAERALRPEIDRRLGAIVQAEDHAIALQDDLRVTWDGAAVARLAPGPRELAPAVQLIGAELGGQAPRARAERRLETWAAAAATRDLAALANLHQALETGALTGLARGLAYQLIEAGGVLERAPAAETLAALSNAERRALRAQGVRIGTHLVFLPALCKPKAARLRALLHAAAKRDAGGRAFLPPPGRTSLPAAGVPAHAATAAGYRPCGPVLIRHDIVERLADLIRAAREAQGPDAPGFPVTDAMLNLLGLQRAQMAAVLKSLGYRRARRAAPAPTPSPAPTPADETASVERAETPPADEQSPPPIEELWRPIRRKTAPQAKTSAAPPPTDGPFAALAALQPGAERAPKPAGRRRRRRPRAAKPGA